MLKTSIANADVFQVNAGIATSHFERGINISEEQAVASLSLDWSSNQGLFAGTECYQSNSKSRHTLPHGCQFYLGYFTTLQNKQALSVSLTHKDYANTIERQWDYTLVTLDWHLNQRIMLSLSATDDWLGRSFAATMLDGKIQYPLNKHVNTYIGLGLMRFESTTPIDQAALFEAGLSFEKNRWRIGLDLISTSRDMTRMTGFDIDQPEVSFNIRYRLY